MKMITSLAVSNVKKNRTRSILIMISIFMTTLLLTAIGSGMKRPMQGYYTEVIMEPLAVQRKRISVKWRNGVNLRISEEWQLLGK